ncbi:MAG: manganese-binding transcriptional regulator MntR [Alphaproteobacteria bacterium]|jgi:DtxR family manganese transport transcriptional regulator|nr:manganese-binding transcriptional regulator MntR [Alphaproteobacteria bacterium]MDG2466051.1 manganese-binding transcriptional regulator MntR [Alphaproteobacteria bacterium]
MKAKKVTEPKKAATPADSDIATSAARFDRIRRAHQKEVAEDYVEMIAELIDQSGEARISDLAARFGVSAPTVNATIQRLHREGLVVTAPYQPITLSDKGQTLAISCSLRHAVLRDFLLSIGVDPITADADAEGMEHHISDETLAAFKQMTDQKRDC